MSISRRTIRRIIQEAMPQGGVPDIVGAVTGVYGEDERQRRDSPARAGELMLIWNELQVGDLIDVDADYNFYPRVRIIQKVDDVSLESGNAPGPGFIGKESNGDTIVFPVEEVDPASYEKYALAERKTMRVSKRQLKRIIKEEKAKLIRESVSDMDEFEATIIESAVIIADKFITSMEQLFVEDPEMFRGRSTDAEWSQQVEDAGEEIRYQLEEAISTVISRVENQLHDGQYHRGPHKPF